MHRMASKPEDFGRWLALRATVNLAVVPDCGRKKSEFQDSFEAMITVYKSFTEPPDWKSLMAVSVADFPDLS